MKVSRILNGMWQVSGAHGYDPNKEKAVAEMAYYADEGMRLSAHSCTYTKRHVHISILSKNLILI